MSKLTDFLKLFCYDPATDDAATFNIDEALNKNWAKVDAKAQEQSEGLTKLRKDCLTPETAEMLGLARDAVPDTAFRKLLTLLIGNGNHGYDVFVKFENGTPAADLTISGLSSASGTGLKTDASGHAFGVSSKSTVNITVEDKYIDIAPTSQTVTSSESITPVTIVLRKNAAYKQLGSSKTYDISPLTTSIDVTAVGGGAGGGEAEHYIRQSVYGSGGGVVSTVRQYTLKSKQLTLLVGAAGQPNKPGGTTILKDNGAIVVQAAGGTVGTKSAPGVGCGNGGDTARGSKGGDCTKHIFDDPSLPLAGSGGGGGSTPNEVNQGGAPNGGHAGSGAGHAAKHAENGKYPGGAGGSSMGCTDSISNPGKGASGCLYIRPAR